MVMSDDGEFIHENDIKLYLMYLERETTAEFNGVGQEETEWMKKYKYALETKLEMIDKIINNFK